MSEDYCLKGDEFDLIKGLSSEADYARLKPPDGPTMALERAGGGY